LGHNAADGTWLYLYGEHSHATYHLLLVTICLEQGGVVLPPGFNLIVERLRATTTEDTHGNTIPNWATPDILAIKGCWVGSANGVEIVDGRQTVVTEQYWWGPQDADILPADRVRDVEASITYEVDSPVLVHRDPTGRIGHKTCKLKLVE
jgi:hypothetical protein